MRPETKEDRFKYYEYVLIYVDNILTVSAEPAKVMKTLASLYKLKEDPLTRKKYAKPERYLGANVGEFKFPDRGTAWYMSADDYVKEAVRNVEADLDKTFTACLQRGVR